MSACSVSDVLSPAGEVRVVLAALREQGRPFSEAWPIAIQRVRVRRGDPVARDLIDWKEAIRWAEPHFAAAYDGSEPPMPEHITLVEAEELVA